MVGLFLLSAAGTSISMRARSILGFLAALTLSFGGFWYSTLQSIITTQYAVHRQGEAAGVLSQLAQLVNFLAYPTSLTFSYMISSDKKAVYWPGICFALAGIYHGIAITLHVYTFGFTKACHLLRREKKDRNGDENLDINMITTAEDNGDGNSNDGDNNNTSSSIEKQREWKLKLQASPGLHAAV